MADLFGGVNWVSDSLFCRLITPSKNFERGAELL